MNITDPLNGQLNLASPVQQLELDTAEVATIIKAMAVAARQNSAGDRVGPPVNDAR